MITPQQEALMLNGADCPLHYHSIDRVPTHDTLNQLEEVAHLESVSNSTYVATYDDDYINVNATSIVTMPPAKAGKEIEVIKTFAGGTVTIIPTGANTIQGTTSVVATVQWTALRFKAMSDGWIII